MFYKNWFQTNEEKIWKDFFSFLSIETISADPTFHKELLKGADFVEERLKKLGMVVSRWEELKAPVLFGEKIIDLSFPTVLIYGHYDVQPVDPLELWHSFPFKPEVRDGRIYARGAEDNKGQNFYSLLACEAFYAKHPNPKLNIKFLIEGGEEIGSPGFSSLVEKYKHKLKADSVWVVDMGIESYDHPLLSLGVRGLVPLEVKVSNAEFDLHSGAYGGAVYNPITALCEMIASVYNKDGKIQIEGFYDDIIPLSEEDKGELYFDSDQSDYEKETTATCFKKQLGCNLQESISIYPTFELNGIYGGYQGEGSKTIIPSSATAKITCRLVDGQEPSDIVKKVKDFLLKQAPEGMKVSFKSDSGGKSAWARPSDYSAKVFAKIIDEITGKKCKFTYSGGSIPVIEILSKASGNEFIFLGTALPEDRIHAPNESFSQKQFIDGYNMITKGLEVFAENKKGW